MPIADRLLVPVTLASILGCGLIAGVFFAFSAFVMKALGRLPAEKGIAAMQSINVVVLNPLFLGVFVGTAVACVLGIAFSLMRWQGPGEAHVLVGGALYLLGTFLVTVAFNVPLNEELAKVDPASQEGAAVWATYLVKWTAWNHVRTVAAALAMLSFALSLFNRAQP